MFVRCGYGLSVSACIYVKIITYLIVRCPMVNLYEEVESVTRKYRREGLSLQEHDPWHSRSLDFLGYVVGPTYADKQLNRSEIQL